MPFVKELYGFALGKGGERRAAIRQASCPHMMSQCDGGGNRDMARWPAEDQPLALLFDRAVGEKGGGFIPCGICSIHVPGSRSGGAGVDWAICPRRLLSFEASEFSASQLPLAKRVLRLGGFQEGDNINVWSEIRLLDRAAGVDYRFDYVLRKEEEPPVIVEIMTSSTSAGNRRKRTDIQSAFANAVLFENGIVPQLGQSPTVNARQVWARMMSQMIVKSEIANHWGGHAIWVVQDSLRDYIKRSTGLNLDALHSDEWDPGEVNLISASIDNPDDIELYSGPIRPRGSDETFWLELPTAPGLPDMNILTDRLATKDTVATLTVKRLD